MLLSRKHKFIFIHICKAGGISVTALLQQLTPLHRVGRHHNGVPTAKQVFGPQFSEYFSFAFVRNPWDRLVSAWHDIQLRRPWMRKHYTDFADFIAHHAQRERHLRWTQSDLLCDSGGKPLVNAIYRFENFVPECRRMLHDLDFPAMPIPRRNTSRHRHYSIYYTAYLRRIVAEHYARDCANFNYIFEEKP